MKITDIKIVNMRSHKNSEITGLEKVNWFFGDNATGKSTILDAISYAFTGVCRGTDEGGRAADRLIMSKNGTASADSFAIELKTDRGVIRRVGPGHGPTSKMQDQIDKLTGSGRSTIRSLIDVSHFFLQDAKAQKEILQDILDLRPSNSMVEQAVGQAVWEKAKHLTYDSIDALDTAYAYWFERRKELKKKIDKPVAKVDLSKFPDEVKAMDLESAERSAGTIHDKVEALRNEMAASLVTTKVVAAGSLRKMVETTKTEIVGLEKAMKPLMKDYSIMFSDLALKMDENNSKRQGMGDENPGDPEALSATLEALKGMGKAKCPTCQRALSEPQKAKQVTKLENMIKKAVMIQQREEKLMGEMDTLNDKANQLQLEMDQHKSYTEQIAKKQKQLKELEQDLKDSDSEPGQDHEKAKELSDRVKKGSAILRTMNEYIAALKTQAEVPEQASHDDLEAAEKMVGICGPKGIRVGLIGNRMESFTAMVNDYIAPFGFHMTFEMEPFVCLVNHRRAEMLSESEALRAGLALQAALAKHSGLNFICIDAVEKLGHKARMALWQSIKSMDIDQIILCGSITKELSEFKPVKMPEVATFYVDLTTDGVSTVKRVA